MPVTLDRDGISIDAEHLYLLAGQVHYFRWPRAEWRDVLLKTKAAGLNTIDTVIPWNLHEPWPGEYDFAGEADLGAYLDLCGELGLYAIVRPGPYICAEWENGGFPAWLTGKGPRLRIDDPEFLAATERWFDVLLPMLAARQVARGGPIILVQIENEHWASGVYGHDGHQATLAAMLRRGGIEVPLYTCVGAMPGVAEFRNGWSGMGAKLQATRAAWPENPMIVSELWSGWFDNWGASAHNGKTAAALDRVMHELIAVGASGVSHWMWAGGTNFGMWGGRTVGGDTVHMTASYDYDAPLDEYGRPTEKYYTARRHHLLLGTLGAGLARALADAGPGGPQVLVQPAVSGRAAGGDAPYRVARHGDFSAAFLQNTTLERQTVQVFSSAPPMHLSVEVEAGTIKPLYFNLPLPGGAQLRYHTGRILGYWPGMLVCYGFPGEVGALELLGAAPWELLDDGGARVAVDGARVTVRYWITDRPTVVRMRGLSVVLLSEARAERWWPLPDGAFACGPDLVLADGTATPGLRPEYRVDAGGRLSAQGARAGEIALEWETMHVAELDADAAEWQALPGPRAFEDLGCLLGYGWYSARVELPAPLDTTLAAPGVNDRAHVYADGRYAGTLGAGPDGPRWTLPLRLAAGAHELRLLVDNLGRFNYGARTGERKGLVGDLYLGAVQEDFTRGWTALWQEAAFAGEAIANAQPAQVRADAADVDLGACAYQGPHIWWLREFEAAPGEGILVQFTGDRNPGALYLNGEALQRFSRHHGGGYLLHDLSARLRPGTNVLAMHVENYGGLAWRGTLLRYAPERRLHGRWAFHAGVTPGAPGTPAAGLPRFYRARFAYDAGRDGPGPLRFEAAELRKGHLWLNGRALGRYWQIGPQEYYKAPAAWLQAENELLVFEEEGGHPFNATLRSEKP